MEETKNVIVKYGILKGLTYLATTGALSFIGGNVFINNQELISLDNLIALIGGVIVLFIPKLLAILQNVIPMKTDSAVATTINRATLALQDEFKLDILEVRKENAEILALLLEQKEEHDKLFNDTI